MAKMIHTKAGYMTKEEAKMIGDVDKQTKKRDKHMKSIGVAVGTVRSKDKLDVPVVNGKGKTVGSMPNDTFWRLTSINRINGKEYYKVDSDRYILKKYVVFKGGMTREDNHTS
ncbi:hypothetical protein FC88_GL000191 [Companilactobacillus futsaii JCM 17355]|nr:hypothetical protein FC88_GL000191 [Companilactobacillus futsaii JCM 17355]